MITTTTTTPVRALHGKRLCGNTRSNDSIYVEFGLSPGGEPVESFLVDYPVVLPPTFKVPTQGVRIAEVQGVYHVFDRIGETYYPGPEVFVEEVRALGLSRKIAATTPGLDKLGPGSTIQLIHDRGWVNEWEQFRCAACGGIGDVGEAGGQQDCSDCRGWGGWICPQHRQEHQPHRAAGCCAGIWWQNYLGVGLGPQKSLTPLGARAMPGSGSDWWEGTVSLPCGRVYRARWNSTLQPQLTYSRSIVARFPISCLAVVTQGGSRGRNLMNTARRSGLPVVEDTR